MSAQETQRGPTVAERIHSGMAELEAIMAAGQDPRRVLTWRAAEVREPAEYGPGQVRQVHDSLGLSQPLFAKLVGVSAALVKLWEQRRQKREPAPWARRILDAMRSDPAYWRSLVQTPTGTANGRSNEAGATSGRRRLNTPRPSKPSRTPAGSRTARKAAG